MTDLHFTKPHTKGKHLHYEDRIRLETYLREGRKKVEMAQLLECSRQTLDHEIARGRERVRTAPSAARPYWGEERLRPYNAAYAQAQYQLARKSSRKKRVVESFPDLFEALKIVLQPEKGKKKRSVEVALHELLDKFPEQPCVARERSCLRYLNGQQISLSSGSARTSGHRPFKMSWQRFLRSMDAEISNPLPAIMALNFHSYTPCGGFLSISVILILPGKKAAWSGITAYCVSLCRKARL